MARPLCIGGLNYIHDGWQRFEFKFVLFSPTWNYGDLPEISLLLKTTYSSEYGKFIQAADMQCHA